MDIWDIILEDNKEIEELAKKFYEKPLVICCAGAVGRALAIWAFENKIELVGICDNSLDKQGTKIMGLTIQSVACCVKEYGNSVNYITASMGGQFHRALYNQLKRLGIESLNIYEHSFAESRRVKRPFNFNNYVRSAKYKIDSHGKEINSVIDMLEDTHSVEVYTKMISREFNECSYTIADKYFCKEGYFYHDFLNYNSHERLIQCGVFNGLTIKEFIDICPDYEWIIGIEADFSNYANSMWVTSERDVRLMYNAVSDKREMVSFESTGTGRSKISNNGNGTVLAIRGDELKCKPTMIQMDIEGAEMRALRGFKETIKECKPKLAICLYHSIEDHWDIPLYIKSLVPEYRFWVRNDCMVNRTHETVLFASV